MNCRDFEEKMMMKLICVSEGFEDAGKATTKGVGRCSNKGLTIDIMLCYRILPVVAISTFTQLCLYHIINLLQKSSTYLVRSNVIKYNCRSNLMWLTTFVARPWQLSHSHHNFAEPGWTLEASPAWRGFIFVCRFGATSTERLCQNSLKGLTLLHICWH